MSGGGRTRAHSTGSQGSQGARDAVAVEKVALLPGSTPSSAIFVVTDEDHTLGNAVRHVAAQDASVKLAAYSIPHPLENKMRLQIDTRGNVTAKDALARSLDALREQIVTVREQFKAA